MDQQGTMATMTEATMAAATATATATAMAIAIVLDTMVESLLL